MESEKSVEFVQIELYLSDIFLWIYDLNYNGISRLTMP